MWLLASSLFQSYDSLAIHVFHIINHTVSFGACYKLEECMVKTEIKSRNLASGRHYLDCLELVQQVYIKLVNYINFILSAYLIVYWYQYYVHLSFVNLILQCKIYRCLNSKNISFGVKLIPHNLCSISPNNFLIS